MNNFVKRVMTGAFLILIFIAIFILSKPIITSIAIISALIYIIIFEYTKLFDYKKLGFWLVLPFYPVLPFLLGAYMSYFSDYRQLIVYLIILAQVQDIGGYVFGNLFGRHKLAPKLSPKKSWEGFIGGILFSGIILFVILSIKNIIFILIFSVLVATLGTAGDLLESYFKRRAGIKDIGNILPGHGGLLDRFDSCLILALLFFVFRDYLVRVFGII